MKADCHVHMALDGLDYKKALARQPDENWVRERLAAYRDANITYIRDGGDRFGAAALAAQLGPEYGVDYRQPGFPIYKNGHYGGFIGRSFDTLSDFRALVSQVRCQGGDFIKVMISGLMDFTQYGRLTGAPLSPAEIRDLTACAHDAGFAVMVHANGADTVRAALTAGVDSIEHGAYLDDECLHQLAESRAVWVPTLVTISNLIGCGRFPDAVLKAILKTQLTNVRKAGLYGAAIALGSDAGAHCVPHVSGARDEAALLTRALGSKAADSLEVGRQDIFRRF